MLIPLGITSDSNIPIGIRQEECALRCLTTWDCKSFDFRARCGAWALGVLRLGVATLLTRHGQMITVIDD